MINGDNNVMVDIETLGLGVKSVIIAIGACRFNDTEIVDKFYRVIQPDSQPHNLICPQTVKWWMKTDSALLAEMINDGSAVTLKQGLISLYSWMMGVSHTEINLWANSPHFDCVMLERNAQHYELPFPNFRSWRDIRTILKVFGFKRDLNNHNALDDAVNQAEALIALNKELKDGKWPTIS